MIDEFAKFKAEKISKKFLLPLGLGLSLSGPLFLVSLITAAFTKLGWYMMAGSIFLFIGCYLSILVIDKYSRKIMKKFLSEEMQTYKKERI